MPQIDHILFPVDFSDRCAQLAPVVALWVKKYSAHLTLLHAVPPLSPVDRESSGPLYAEFEQQLQATAATRLRAFQDLHFSSQSISSQPIANQAGLNQTIERLVHMGDPGGLIVQFAEDRKPDLIMMATHGYGPFRRFLTGSVTSKVLHDVACPVWTATHAEKAIPGKAKVQKVLCAVDQGSPEKIAAAVDLIRRAAWLAEQNGAELRILHVMAAVDETSTNRGEKAVRRFHTEQARKGMAAILKASKQPASALILRGGNIADLLADEAAKQKAGLVVIGRGQIKKRFGRLRTHSLSIVCKSPCPVLSV